MSILLIEIKEGIYVNPKEIDAVYDVRFDSATRGCIVVLNNGTKIDVRYTAAKTVFKTIKQYVASLSSFVELTNDTIKI